MAWTHYDTSPLSESDMPSFTSSNYHKTDEELEGTGKECRSQICATKSINILLLIKTNSRPQCLLPDAT